MSEKIHQRQTEIITLMKSTQDLISKYLSSKKERLLQLSEMLSSKSKINKHFQNPNSKLQQIFNAEQDHEIALMNNNQTLINEILTEYEHITGITIQKTKEKHLKINFTFIEDVPHYIILSINDDSIYNIIELSPQTLNIQPYLTELNKTKNLTMFLSKFIYKELLSKINNNNNSLLLLSDKQF